MDEENAKGIGLTDGLDVVLTWLDRDLGTMHLQVSEDLNGARETADRLGAARRRLDKIVEHVEYRPIQESGNEEAASDESQAHEGSQGETADWGELAAFAQRVLVSRGVDPSSVHLDALLDRETVDMINRRFSGDFSIRSHLDCYDVAASVAAGLAAAMVDFLVVRIPASTKYLGQHTQTGSPLTGLLKSVQATDDNWMSHYFKAAYDKVRDVQVSGFGPRTHRLQTPGHDPLLGLVVGTADIVRGGLTAIDRQGKLVSLGGTATPVFNPFTALVLQIGHLCSDGFTTMGLPPPGWSLLQAIQVGSFGEKERTVGELARFMYLRGYDSRHFLTMSTSVAAAEVVLRGYYWLRRKYDRLYDEENSHQCAVVGAEKTSQHPRFQAMSLAAHGLAVAANAGKVAIWHGNPLAINYAQWIRFVHSFFAWARVRMRPASDVLKGHARANLKAISEGWPEVDTSDPSMPSLNVD